MEAHFLDEIGDVPLELQTKLSRAAGEGVRAAGKGSRTLRTDAV